MKDRHQMKRELFMGFGAGPNGKVPHLNISFTHQINPIGISPFIVIYPPHLLVNCCKCYPSQ